MSQRQITRRAPMDLPSSMFERAPPQPFGDADEGMVVQSGSNQPPNINIGSSNFNSHNNNSNVNNQWELQQLGGREQDPLLHNPPPPTTKTTRGFSLWDLLVETASLTRARNTYFLMLLTTFLTVSLLLEGLITYLFVAHNQHDFIKNVNSTVACQDNILRPWVKAAMAKNLSATQQDEFYQLFRQNCTMFKDPATEFGTYNFTNGTISITSHGEFVRAFNPFTRQLTGVVVAGLISSVWTVWFQVAMIWGLYAATTTLGSHHSRPSHRDAIHMPAQKLTEAFREQFSYKVVLGLIRIILTEILEIIMMVPTLFLIATVRYAVVNGSVSLKGINTLMASPSNLWMLANPVPLLFLLSKVAAALEPGVWGFKAVWRGVQVGRGNRMKCCVVYVVLFFWEYVCKLVKQPVDLTAMPQFEVVLSIMIKSLREWVGDLPGAFLLPVLYFLCKSWREKEATMA